MKRTVMVRISDLSGVVLEPATSQEIKFSLQGMHYAIDLTNEEAVEFELALHPYLENATRLRKRPVAAVRRR